MDIQEAGLRLRLAEADLRKEFPFTADLTFWDADEARILIYEKPMEIETRLGTNVLLAGKPRYRQAGRLVFDIDDIISLQFANKRDIDTYLQAAFIMAEGEQPKFEFTCPGLENMKQYCSRTDDRIKKTVVQLMQAGFKNVYQSLYDAMTCESPEDDLLRRVSFLRSMVLRYKENQDYWKPEMYRLRLI